MKKYTVDDIITMFNTEYPNTEDDTGKVQMLEDLDRQILNDVILTHEYPAEDDPEHHFDDWGSHSELFVPSPYHDLYLHYMAMKIALRKNDTKRYNVFATETNNAMLTYQKWYNKTYRPVQVRVPWYRHNRWRGGI